ncbi:MAG: FliI/YscN family ATPase [Ignavibacteria bacterium]|jgi:flagellum-specific ATP synthase|nr:FliI/YscN family ATPase [Ignavibacteria bacterium]
MFELTNKNTLKQRLSQTQRIEMSGKITQVVGLVIESEGPKAPIGEICILKDRFGNEVTQTEIVGFKENNRILSMVIGNTENISPGMELVATGHQLSVGVGDGLLGRVIDGLGNPIDNLGAVHTTSVRSIYADPPNPLLRKRIAEPISTGIRAIDGLITFGKGQRVGIFAGSGVGKSTTIGMIARNASADINVICLIGERGREVREFIEKDLGKAGLERSVVVCATGDTPALVRIKCALLATAIAEHFRDKGQDVLLMMDSVTRLAMAQREVGLTIGEPPTTKGYTPSVFSLMQKTMERAGTSDIGSITGLYTVLVEGDDMNEPIADTARGILDGHIVLSRHLASAGHYPAIDVLQSISRVRGDVTTPEHKKATQKIIEMMATYKDVEDLISVGAYRNGTNPRIDRSIALHDPITNFLRQGVTEGEPIDSTIEKMYEIVGNE